MTPINRPDLTEDSLFSQLEVAWAIRWGECIEELATDPPSGAIEGISRREQSPIISKRAARPRPHALGTRQPISVQLLTQLLGSPKDFAILLSNLLGRVSGIVEDTSGRRHRLISLSIQDGDHAIAVALEIIFD
jgi:hypothetical protein